LSETANRGCARFSFKTLSCCRRARFSNRRLRREIDRSNEQDEQKPQRTRHVPFEAEVHEISSVIFDQLPEKICQKI
jgi:hypothetical protein